MIYNRNTNDTTEVIFFASKNKLPRPDGTFTIPSATAVATLIFPGIYEKIEGESKNGKLTYTSSGTEYHKVHALKHNRWVPLRQKIDSIDDRLETL